MLEDIVYFPICIIWIYRFWEKNTYSFHIDNFDFSFFFFLFINKLYLEFDDCCLSLFNSQKVSFNFKSVNININA